MNYYRQVMLKNCQVYKVVWIPEKFCKEGKTLKLKNNSQWLDGWLVVKVFSGRFEEDYLLKHERDYMTQREASDI